MTNMRAMRLEKPDRIEREPLREVQIPVPDPGPGEIRLQVRSCGLCHTDLHTVEGEIVPPVLPRVPGHQIVGIVEARGRNARLHAEGARVGAGWLGGTCGRCRFCAAGDENLCGEAVFTGFHRDGGYAEFAVVREECAFSMPAAFDDVTAAPLLCAGVIGYRAYRLSGVRPGGRLGLFGFGASAHLVLQIARHDGCEVCVFTRSENHREAARELGAAWVGGASDTPPGLLDGSILFAPAGRLVPEALRRTRRGGTVAVAAVYLTPIPELDYGELLFGERVLKSVTASTRADARDLLERAAAVPVRVEAEAFPMREANRALARLKGSGLRAAGVLLPG